MTLSLSKLMASDAPLTDDERKRLLAIAKAAKGWEYTMYTDGNSSFDEIKAVCKALRASLEGVEL